MVVVAQHGMTCCIHSQSCSSLAPPSGLPIRDAILVAVAEHALGVDVEIRWEDIVDVHAGGRLGSRVEFRQGEWRVWYKDMGETN